MSKEFVFQKYKWWKLWFHNYRIIRKLSKAFCVRFDRHDFIHTIQVKALQSACDYKQKEIDVLKDENDILKNYTIVGYKIGIEELEAQNKRLDMAKSFYEGRCKKIEMEKHKLIAALLIYAEYENDGSGDMYYNYDIAQTTLSEIGHEFFEGL